MEVATTSINFTGGWFFTRRGSVGCVRPLLSRFDRKSWDFIPPVFDPVGILRRCLVLWKLEQLCWRKYDDMLSSSDTILECHRWTDRQTDRQTELLYQYCVSAITTESAVLHCRSQLDMWHLQQLSAVWLTATAWTVTEVPSVDCSDNERHRASVCC